MRTDPLPPKEFTAPVDVRDGSYGETTDSIDLKWVRKKLRYVMIPEDIIRKRITFMARQITRDYQDSNALLLITVLQGAQKFAAELAYQIDNEYLEFDSIRISSYMNDRSTGEGHTTMHLKNDVDGKDLLLVEDIVDTGRQMEGFIRRLRETASPRSIRIVSLTEKPARRVAKDLVIDYCGFIVPDEFIVGYGMDYNEKYRNLPFIGVLREEIFNRS